MSTLSRKQQTQKRHRRLRRHLNGSAERPRLAVFRSNNHIYAQVIDDEAQSTLCSASTVDKELRASLKADGSSCCLLYTSPSPRDKRQSRMPSSA